MVALLAAAVRLLPSVGAGAQLAATSRAAAESEKRWAKIPGGEGTVCSQGGPYSFYFRTASPDKLMVYFQGGGACWRYGNCDLGQQPTYDPAVDAGDDPKPSGIFDLGNAGNPLADYSVLFLPYCTGDVHLGDKEAVYSGAASPGAGDTGAARSVRIHHNGYRNAMAAIEWASARVKAPSDVFVAGESAGAIATPFYADRLADRYPKARVVQLGDSGGGYRSPAVPGLLEAWGAIEVLRRFAFNVPSDTSAIRFETLYTATARNHPTIRLAQVNTAEDETQVFFLAQIGMPNAVLDPLLERNYADIRAASPAFRAFTASGKVHVILRRPQFYSLEAGGVRLRDWVAGLVAGRRVDDVPATRDK